MDSIISTLINIGVFAVVLGVLVVIHEFGHFLVAKLSKVKVTVFSIGFGLVIWSKQLGELSLRLCIVPLGGYVKMAGFEQDEYKGKPYEYLSKPVGIRSRIVASGPVVNYIFGWFLFCLVFLGGIQVPTSEVGKVLDDYPAVQAGIQEGDVIVDIDGTSVDTWEEITQIIHGIDKESIRVTVLRKGQEKVFSLIPKREEVKTIFGEEKTVSFIGITPSENTRRVTFSFPEAIIKATQKTLQLTSLTFKGLAAAITNKVPIRQVVGGPIAIYHFTAQAYKAGLSAVVGLTAYLSLCLAIFNLLPLPILDGGHIFFLGLEKIRKKRLSFRTEEIITKTGFVIILIIAVLVLWNDLLRFGPEFLRQ